MRFSKIKGGWLNGIDCFFLEVCEVVLAMLSTYCFRRCLVCLFHESYTEEKEFKGNG
jgi:hypothetical protein